MDEIRELAKTDRNAAVRRVMEAWSLGWAQAALIIAVELGEYQGDLFTTDKDGNEVPLVLPAFDWRKVV
jgi:hypothetical protein